MSFDEHTFPDSTLLTAISGVARTQGGPPAAVFYPLGHPAPYSYAAHRSFLVSSPGPDGVGTFETMFVLACNLGTATPPLTSRDDVMGADVVQQFERGMP
jgi:hypothetical protein